jgi:acyl-CoA thioesterase I
MRSPAPVLLVLLSAAALVASACEPDPRAEGPPPPDEAALEPAPAAAAADRPAVVFLGTSLTAGLGLRSDRERFPEQLGRIADSAGTPVRVVNAGVSGETSAGGLRRLDWALQGPVDLLVVELGANDGLRGQDPSALEANLRAIIREARATRPGLPVLLLGMEAPPNLGPEYTRRFREVFPRVARDEGTALVPFLLDGVAGEPALNQADGIHPTAAGHRLMARTVWPTLDSLLRAGKGS